MERAPTTRVRLRSVAGGVSALDELRPAFEPGSTQQYSNFGFAGTTPTVSKLARATLTTSRPTSVSITGKRQSNCLAQPARGLPSGGKSSTVADQGSGSSSRFEGGKSISPALLEHATQPDRLFMGVGAVSTGHTPEHRPRVFSMGPRRRQRRVKAQVKLKAGSR